MRDTLNPKSKSKSGESMDKKYDLSKSHVYVCTNCGYESIYRLPREVAERMGDLPVQTLKRECRNAMNTFQHQDGVKAWQFIIAQQKQSAEHLDVQQWQQVPIVRVVNCMMNGRKQRMTSQKRRCGSF